MATINGTNYADSLYGTSSADVIYGRGGNDTMKGFGGADHLDGGAGFDTIFYDDSTVGVSVNLATGRGFGGTAEGDTYASIEAVYGSAHNDTITGNDANNSLFGLSGNDVMKGGGGYDYLSGGDGEDILKGGGGADYLDGGAGTDTADYSQAGPTGTTTGVSVYLATNTAYFGEAEGDIFSSIENVTGSTYNDNLGGTDVANVLKGLDGIDHLYGHGGDDLLEGGNGNDWLDGGTGNDRMAGGGDDDTYFVDSAGDVIIEAAGYGSDVIRWSATYTLAADVEVEDVFAGDQASTAAVDFTGNGFDQYISGNAGNNVLSGLGGSDSLSGREGFDRLFGGDGDDALFGHDGPDDMIGGSGLDMFVYYWVYETGTAPGTFDVIHDFNRAEGDKVHVGQMDSMGGNETVDDWTFIGNAAFSAPGQIAFSSDGIDTFLLFNIDNDAIHEATIRVLGLHTVDASWFVI